MLFRGLISNADSGDNFQTTKRVKLFGVGTYTKGLYVASTRSGSKTLITKEYDTWRHMLQRGHCPKYKHRNKSYVNVTTDVVFRDFQRFCLWGKDQVGFGLRDYCLDKDILVKGNKIYCPDYCVFVPQAVNKLFTKREARRGNCPIGVSTTSSGKYMARLGIGGEKEKYLGSFSTQEEAFNTYKIAKEEYIKYVAGHWKHKMSNKVYEAMNKYIVEIDD